MRAAEIVVEVEIEEGEVAASRRGRRGAALTLQFGLQEPLFVLHSPLEAPLQEMSESEPAAQ